ncbi:MAG: HAMP domain-containing histidine kinase [Chloroflexi bacterium]|nr:HAMP domain-containing histidine kinase [Chloroflexota bacterium]
MNLTAKLTIPFLIMFVLIAALTGILINNSVDTVTSETASQRLSDEESVVQGQITNLDNLMIARARGIANISQLGPAITSENTLVLELLVESAQFIFRSDDFEILNAAGLRLYDHDQQASPQAVEQTQRLIDFATNGITVSGLIIDEMDGTPRPRLAAASPVYDATGEIIGVVFVAQDFDNAVLNELNFNRDDVDVAVLIDGDVVASTGIVALDAEAVDRATRGQRVLDEDIEGGTGQIYAPVSLGTGNVAVAISVDFAEIEAFRGSIIRTTSSVIIIIGLLALTGLAGGLLIFVVRPVRKMRVAAEEIAGGNYHRRVDVVTRDEIGTLAATFNNMADALERRERRQRELRESLEQSNINFEIANEEVQRANRLKDEFLTNVSHELRTPLNGVMGYLGILDLSDEMTANDRLMVDRARASANRLRDLITDLLDANRMEMEAFVLTPTAFSLQSLIERQRENAETFKIERKLDFHLEVANNMPSSLWGDDEAINRVISNLVSNAFKFTRQGSVTLKIDHEDRNMIVQVIDTGIGIPVSKRDLIFERFYQIEPDRTQPGTGLGLAIVKNLVEEMNGSIELTSAPNKGTIFTVRLPILETTEVT